MRWFSFHIIIPRRSALALDAVPSPAPVVNDVLVAPDTTRRQGDAMRPAPPLNGKGWRSRQLIPSTHLLMARVGVQSGAWCSIR
jgi:hypothetical protein